jgi:hypothetical protein
VIEEKTRTGNVTATQAYTVCGSKGRTKRPGTCNDGWMNDLEKAMRDLSTPLILGNATNLNQNQQLTIARWLALKTMLIDSMFRDRDRSFVEASVRQNFYRTQDPPHGWRMWIGSLTGPKWRQGIRHCPRRVGARDTVIDQPSIDAVRHPHCCIPTAIGIGQLFLMAVSTKGDFLRDIQPPVAVFNYLAPIFPISPTPVHLPLTAMDDETADFVSTSFSVSIRYAQTSRTGLIPLMPLPFD